MVPYAQFCYYFSAFFIFTNFILIDFNYILNHLLNIILICWVSWAGLYVRVQYSYSTIWQWLWVYMYVGAAIGLPLNAVEEQICQVDDIAVRSAPVGSPLLTRGLAAPTAWARSETSLHSATLATCPSRISSLVRWARCPRLGNLIAFTGYTDIPIFASPSRFTVLSSTFQSYVVFNYLHTPFILNIKSSNYVWFCFLS